MTQQYGRDGGQVDDHCRFSGKMAFPSMKAAKARARQIGEGMKAYECFACGRFHIGHPRKQSKRRQRP